MSGRHLPSGWSEIPIGQLGEFRGGATPSKSRAEYWDRGTIPWVTAKDMKRTHIADAEDHITPAGLSSASVSLVPPGSVLMVMRSGILRHTFPVAVATQAVTVNQDLKALILRDGLCPEYILYALLGFGETIRQRTMKTGTTVQSIMFEELKRQTLPIPSIDEQERIVAKIEELYTAVGYGRSLLRETQTALDNLAVLAGEMSFRGTGTISVSRETCLAAEIAEYAEKRFRWKKRGVVPSLEGTSFGDWQLPETWAWTTLDEIAADKPGALKAGPFGSALKKEFYVSEGYKVYGQEQVIRGDARYGDYYIDSERFKSLRTCEVVAGDLLVSLVGTIGKTLVLPQDAEPGIINPRLVKVSLSPQFALPEYIAAYLRTLSVRRYLSLSSHGGTMQVLNLGTLRHLPIALPPLSVQRAVLRELVSIEESTSLLGDIVQEEATRAESLKQSILRAAFCGELA